MGRGAAKGCAGGAPNVPDRGGGPEGEACLPLQREDRLMAQVALEIAEALEVR
jgi:hypothetical protein